jgi:hypothetical protein
VLTELVNNTIPNQQVLHLCLYPCQPQLNVATGGQFNDLCQCVRSLRVDEIDALEIEYDGLQLWVRLVVELYEPVGERICAGEEETGVAEI